MFNKERLERLESEIKYLKNDIRYLKHDIFGRHNYIDPDTITEVPDTNGVYDHINAILDYLDIKVEEPSTKLKLVPKEKK